MNSDLLRRDLKKAFEGVVNEAIGLKLETWNNKISFKEGLTALGVNIGRDFVAQYCKLDNKLTNLTQGT